MSTDSTETAQQATQKAAQQDARETSEQTPQQRFRNSDPDFPLLDAADSPGVARLGDQGGWLAAGETVTAVSKAGEGNMNLTLRVETDRRSLIVKQSRPWVEKYPQIAAPFDRSLVEETFYRVAAQIPGVAETMPRLISSQPEFRLLVLEDLGRARDFSLLYSSGSELKLEASDVRRLRKYLEALHIGSRALLEQGAVAGEDLEWLRNRDMRQLNWQHIFEIPLIRDNGLELEGFESGLGRVAERLAGDPVLVEQVSALGQRYLADGSSLLHGDFFPGSWLRVEGGIRVIDPEFAFIGDPEFDYGVAVAHLFMARQPWSLVDELVSHAALDRELMAQFAGVEIVRRLIGVAQLPIPPTEGSDQGHSRRRAEMLDRARSAVLERKLEVLRT